MILSTFCSPISSTVTLVITENLRDWRSHSFPNNIPLSLEGQAQTPERERIQNTDTASNNGLDLYCGDAGFESQTTHRLYWLRVFRGFCRSLRANAEILPLLDHDRRLPHPYWFIIYEKKISMVWVRERTKPTERPPLVGEMIAKFEDRGCHVVSVTDLYSRILGFLDSSRYFSIK
jgi:hypothetical protein